MNLIPLIERMIRNGQTDGMQEKLNMLLLFGQVTPEDYERLVGMLPGEE